jgi:K+-transporting ATPase ATPase C chain
MYRRHILTSVMFMLCVVVFFGIVYPAIVTGVGAVVFPWRANGSFITRNGQIVGSALIGQEFLDKQGNPDPSWFQPRPSAAGNGYNAESSGASNLGPEDPREVGFIPGLNTLDLNGNPSKTNVFATSSDPYCVPMDATSGNVVWDPPITTGDKYAKNKDGSYQCDSNTVPERVLAYRSMYGLAASVKVPIDAVTASASGLDPDISIANAMLQAPTVAGARHLPVAEVVALVKRHENNYQWGFLGEKTVNVLDLNLALAGLKP